MITEIYKIGRKIYSLRNWRELHRCIVFMGRTALHYAAIRQLIQFFQANEERRIIIEKNAFPVEQATRAFFYAGSTFAERLELICNHFTILQEKLERDWFLALNTDKSYRIWRLDEDGLDWHVDLHMAPGQRKEGLLAVNMYWEGIGLYQIIFWLSKDKNNEVAMYIGAMQGPNVSNSNELIKEATKRAYRYRTKNLILYMTMAVARSFDCGHIYAVSNEGYYAMNHVRRDRKLKTDFGAFWEEVGGQKTADSRFYEIPLVEPRKTMEEVPTRKRAVYRKRFAFQDDVDVQIAANMEKIMK